MIAASRPAIRTVEGAAATAAALAAYVVLVQPRLATWGATMAEVGERLAGDELVADPATQTTRAVAIEAPASEVWSWLVQIGTDRGGWYSYDWLERAVGVPVDNAEEVRPAWQDLAVGDLVTLAPAGWLGMRDGFVMPVARIEPGASIVLRQEPPRSPWDGIWSFHVRPDGPARCRLVIRSRTAKPSGAAAVAAAIGGVIGGSITFVMERGMLIGIKRRAEHRRRAAISGSRRRWGPAGGSSPSGAELPPGPP